MFKNSAGRQKFAISLIQAGLDQTLVCKAANLSQYEYLKLQKDYRNIPITSV